MPNADQTRWTVTVSTATDRALRIFLAQRGLKKGDLSVFIEEAVNAHIQALKRSEIQDQGTASPEDPPPAVMEPVIVVSEPPL